MKIQEIIKATLNELYGENKFHYILVINPISDYFEYKNKGVSNKNNPYFGDYEFNLIFNDNSHISAISFDDKSLSTNALSDFYGEAKAWEKQTSGNRKIDDVKSNAKMVLLYSYNDEEKINKILSKIKPFKVHFEENIQPNLQKIVNIHMTKIGLGDKSKDDVERKKELDKFKNDLLFKHYDDIERLILIDKLNGIQLYNKVKELYIPILA